MDDASRKILGYGEFEKATAENSIQTLEMALAHASEYKIEIKEVNTDRGTQFYSTRGRKSQFQMYLEERGIRHVISRKSNPQTNGKVERFLLKEDRIDGNSTAWMNL